METFNMSGHIKMVSQMVSGNIIFIQGKFNMSSPMLMGIKMDCVKPGTLMADLILKVNIKTTNLMVSKFFGLIQVRLIPRGFILTANVFRDVSNSFNTNSIF